MTRIEDVKAGDILTGKISNVTHFGAFVDVGLGRVMSRMFDTPLLPFEYLLYPLLPSCYIFFVPSALFHPSLPSTISSLLDILEL